MQLDTTPPTSDEPERKSGGCRRVAKWAAIVVGALFVLGLLLSLVGGDDELTTPTAGEATSGEATQPTGAQVTTTTQATSTTQATTTTTQATTTTTTEPLVLDYPTTRVAGTGTRVADVEIVGGGLCTITMTVEDNIDSSFGTDIESNFAITQVDPPGGFDSLWVNEIAKSGTWQKAVRYEVGSGWVTVQVEAVGDWVIESDCSTRVGDSPRVAGTGTRVADVAIIGGGLCTITMTVEDNVDAFFDIESNFAITQVDPPGGFDSLWVNEIAKSGIWEKAVRFEVGSGWVTVQVEAVGDWTIESDCRG